MKRSTLLLSCRHLHPHVPWHLLHVLEADHRDCPPSHGVRSLLLHGLQWARISILPFPVRRPRPLHPQDHDYDHRRVWIWQYLSSNSWRRHGPQRSTNECTVSRSLLHSVDYLSHSNAHPTHQLAGMSPWVMWPIYTSHVNFTFLLHVTTVLHGS